MSKGKSVTDVNKKSVNVLKDLLCGELSGILTGFLFMFPEYLKVHRQTHMNDPKISIFQSLKDKNFLRKVLRGTATFPPLVGCVGAVQFTCNDKIRESHGNTAGIVASALSGSSFLVVSDHFMLRQEKFGENFREAAKFLSKKRGFFVGYWGIALREAIFMTNMVYIGPWTGQLMQRFSGSSEGEEINLFWNFFGRSTSGLISTLLSQPFDVASRMQQLAFGQKQVRKSPFHTLLDLHREFLKKPEAKGLSFVTLHPWFVGGMWRMWLGSFGGATLGGLYEYFSRQYDKMNE